MKDGVRHRRPRTSRRASRRSSRRASPGAIRSSSLARAMLARASGSMWSARSIAVTLALGARCTARSGSAPSPSRRRAPRSTRGRKASRSPHEASVHLGVVHRVVVAGLFLRVHDFGLEGTGERLDGACAHPASRPFPARKWPRIRSPPMRLRGRRGLLRSRADATPGPRTVSFLCAPALVLVPIAAASGDDTSARSQPPRPTPAERRHDPDNRTALAEWMERCLQGNAKYPRARRPGRDRALPSSHPARAQAPAPALLARRGPARRRQSSRGRGGTDATPSSRATTATRTCAARSSSSSPT